MPWDIAIDCHDGFTIQAINDGCDYWSLIDRFRRGNLPIEALPNRKPHIRKVFIVHYSGRKFVLKWQMAREPHLERLLWHYLAGPHYSTIMRKVAIAKKNGCDNTQAIYLTAESMNGRICEQSFILSEYLEGENLLSRRAPAPEPGVRKGQRIIRQGDSVWVVYPDVYNDISLKITAAQYEAIGTELRRLHSYGLALCDLHPSNILLCGDTVKFIDLNHRGWWRLSLAKDITRLRSRYGIQLPADSIATRIACWYESGLDWLRHSKRSLRTALRRSAHRPGWDRAGVFYKERRHGEIIHLRKLFAREISKINQLFCSYKYY